MKFNSTQLSEIDAVDVVSLRGFPLDSASEYIRKAVDAPYVQVAGKLAQEIADLW
ncbi:MAG: hypothetical protein H0W77_11155, partial [Acidobacteria bacterium]|nr:hypothetical protein [Acidobacteriota bacterium]